MAYVCFSCRWTPAGNYAQRTKTVHSLASLCPKCEKGLAFVHTALPKSKDDHKMWALAEKIYRTPSRRRRRTRHRYNDPLASWEIELLKSSRR